MRKFYQRLVEMADNEKIKITSLEQQIGASQGVLSRAKRNNTGVSVEWIIKILENFPLYNANWLLVGDGKMLKSETEILSDRDRIKFLEKNMALLEENNALLKELSQQREEIQALRAEIEKLQKNSETSV